LQSGAAPADHLESQGAVWFAFFFKHRRQLTRSVFGNADQALITDLVIDCRCFCGHEQVGLILSGCGRTAEQLRDFVLHGLQFVEAQLRIWHDERVAGYALFVNEDAPPAVAGFCLYLL